MNKLNVILLGGGGHGCVVLEALILEEIIVDGIIDPLLEVGEKLFDIPIFGNDYLENKNPAEVLLANGVGSQPYSKRRADIYRGWKARGFFFKTIVHPSAVMSPTVFLEEGVQVMAGSIIQCNTRVRENAVINTRASIDHDCIVGRNVFIGPGAVLCGGVFVQDDVFIGAGAILLPGVTICAGSIIGAGAIIRKDIKFPSMVFGSSAEICRLEERP
jgi:sugar O-acyltransferase (sialic acid O-acetyltransferase NeuD family)